MGGSGWGGGGGEESEGSEACAYEQGEVEGPGGAKGRPIRWSSSRCRFAMLLFSARAQHCVLVMAAHSQTANMIYGMLLAAC